MSIRIDRSRFYLIRGAVSEVGTLLEELETEIQEGRGDEPFALEYEQFIGEVLLRALRAAGVEEEVDRLERRATEARIQWARYMAFMATTREAE